jgi:hypothetical protein
MGTMHWGVMRAVSRVMHEAVTLRGMWGGHAHGGLCCGRGKGR